MAALPIAALIAVLITAVAIHETAHAITMRKAGIRVVEAGIGIGAPRLTLYRRPGFRLVITPWLLGAYVMPHRDDVAKMDALPYRQFAWISNSGIVVNLVAAFGAASVLLAHQMKPVGSIICTTVVIALCAFRRQVAAYVLPALGVPALIGIVWLLSGFWVQGESGLGYSGGDGILSVAPTGPTDALATFAVINLALAIFNSIALGPLDNGKVLARLLRRWFGAPTADAYTAAGVVLLLLMLTGAVVSDAFAIGQAVTGSDADWKLYVPYPVVIAVGFAFLAASAVVTLARRPRNPDARRGLRWLLLTLGALTLGSAVQRHLPLLGWTIIAIAIASLAIWGTVTVARALHHDHDHDHAATGRER